MWSMSPVLANRPISQTPNYETSVFRLRAADVALVAALVLITAIAYASVIDHRFCNWDDGKHVEAIWPPGWETAQKIVGDLRLDYTRVAYYSPLHFLSLMLDQLLIGSHPYPEPWISKVVNVGFHAANSALVFFLLILTGTGRTGALIGALVFALHPLQVGTVAWVAERKNLLCTFFYLSAVVLYIRYLESGRVWLVVAVFMSGLAGLLSKPAAVTLPLVLFFTGIAHGRAASRVPLPGMLLLAALCVLSIGWGLFVLSTERTFPAIVPPLAYRPLIAAGALWFYVWKFVAPLQLAVVYPRWDVVGDPGVFLLLFAGAAGVTLVLWRFRNSMDGWILWGLLFFVVNLLPVSGLVPFGYMVHSFVSDHFVYLPMVGLSLVCARIAERLGAADTTRSRLSTAFPKFGRTFSGQELTTETQRHREEMKTPLRALREKIVSDLQGSPVAVLKNTSPYLRNGELSRSADEPMVGTSGSAQAGDIESRQGKTFTWSGDGAGLPNTSSDPEEKSSHSSTDFSRARLDGPYAGFVLAGVCVWICVLGLLSVRQISVWRDSASLWEATLGVNTGSPAVYNNYGLVCLDKGDYPRALSMFQRAMQLAPRFDIACYNAGKAYFHMGDRDHARGMYRKTLALNPGHEDARFMLAELLKDEGKIQEAIGFLRDSVAKVPGSAVLRSQLGTMLYRQGEQQDALVQFNEALRLDSRLVDALIHKAAIVLENGSADEAIDLAYRALKVYPDARAHHLLGVANATQGRFDEAVVQFEAAERLNPGLEGLRDNLANALIDAGRLIRVRDYCYRAAKAGSPCSDETLTRIQEAAGP